MGKTYSKDEIIDKARELAKMIAETEEVDFFKRAEKQINENVRVQELIGQIKKQQKEAVNLQHYEKHEALKEVEKKIDELNDEIDQIPLVKEFKQSQMDVNGLLQLVSSTISNQVTNEIIESMDGDLLQGTTTKNPLKGGC
ncbi:RicAFT regulatory complex protein RicA family protein [Desertibacillus haloalkaliphilus]|uniref:RicAFT regulatory complex protein RicA family protein n=1 Tax=Desertibacillus haloalkaliphilus TaxID=1328930 RepID=UPI001C269FF1|nr:RicAFT regulatory complex protein RicA family protein [Desertibacillus haloalkaliphilus]MBU8907374.1 RicAFT regulatory complex protein RicA family protein [Desertibacillus haloalkaliphilus]